MPCRNGVEVYFPQGRWPEAEVHLFGSTATRLNLLNCNDLDISLLLDCNPADKVHSSPLTRNSACARLGSGYAAADKLMRATSMTAASRSQRTSK